MIVLSISSSKLVNFGYLEREILSSCIVSHRDLDQPHCLSYDVLVLCHALVQEHRWRPFLGTRCFSYFCQCRIERLFSVPALLLSWMSIVDCLQIGRYFTLSDVLPWGCMRFQHMFPSLLIPELALIPSLRSFVGEGNQCRYTVIHQYTQADKLT